MGGGGGGGKSEKARRSSSARVKLWVARVSTVLLWTCVVHLAAYRELWAPSVLTRWPGCLNQPHVVPSPSEEVAVAVADAGQRQAARAVVLPPKRIYKNNGYLMVSCNGGLNQMRAAICDMVTIARYLNVTLIVPELDKASFWADPSDFQDIFDVDYFIASLRNEVRILRQLPPRLKRRVEMGFLRSLPPVSWSDIAYYRHQILPLIKKYKVIHLNRTDARLANNGLPMEIQKLRCRVNYNALRFTPEIENLGRRLVQVLRRNGPFVVLHLRYEMDMLAFSGCTHGCSNMEAEELTKMRYAYPWWKEKVIDSDAKRKDGLCPLTPEETALVLQALGIDRSYQIYIAAGEIYGGQRRMAALTLAYPNVVRKETLLPSELSLFQNHSSQMAALDYMVSLESDIFIPTYDGNMAKVVEGHRRYLGFKKTVLLNRRHIVELVDEYRNGTLSWTDFSSAVMASHISRMGEPSRRQMIPDKPKERTHTSVCPQKIFQSCDTRLQYNECAAFQNSEPHTLQDWQGLCCACMLLSWQ